jgi:hypothetical protein
MHVRTEDMHICVSSLLKCKIHLHLHDSVGGHLHYASVRVQTTNLHLHHPVRDSQAVMHFSCTFISCLHDSVGGHLHYYLSYSDKKS